MIALDSNVLIDLLIGDRIYAESSEACIGEALRKVRGSFRLAEGFTSTDEAMRAIRGRAPGDPLEPFEVLRDPVDWKPDGGK